MSKPIFPWPGGKRRLADKIIPLFPQHTCYVEPFAGAAAILFFKEPSKVEVLNDVNGDVVNLYRVVQHHLDEFVRQFRWALTSRQIFEWAKAAHPETLTDIQRAARFFYIQKTSFGAKVEGPVFGYATTAKPKLNLLRLEEDLSAAHLRLHQVNIENLPWREVMARYDRPHTLFYCDPPYLGLEGYGVPFPLEEYEALAQVAGTIKGKAVISLNDHPEIRRIFAGFKMSAVSTTYTIGKREGKAPAARELIIRTF